MSYGGNLGASPLRDRWRITNVNALQVDRDLPIYLPPYESLLRLTDGLPWTWGWVCSPFALFWLHYMAVSHRTASGILLDKSKVRGSSMASAVMTSMGTNTNPNTLKKVHEFQAEHGGDPLLLHNLTETDIVLPREQPPVADLCEFVFPEKGPMPPGRTFSQAGFLHTVPEPPAKGHDMPISELCPDVGIIMVSSAQGHEFALIRLNSPDRLRERAIDDLAAQKPLGEIKMPIAGELSAYCPLSGVDRFTEAKKTAEKTEQEQDGKNSKRNRDEGQYFVDESSAALPPKGRGLYKPLQLQEIKIHIFKPVKNNVLFFKREKAGLKVAEGGRRSLRGKAVSTIIFMRHGGIQDPNPRTLTNIYASVSEWHPLTLTLPDGGPKQIVNLLADWETLYAERAVPFPAMQEVAAAFPSRSRVLEQLINHRERIKEVLSDSARYRAEGDPLAAKIDELQQKKKSLDKKKDKKKRDELSAQITAETKKLDKIRPEYNLCTNPDLVQRLLDLLPPDGVK